jgi:hypothetical protein
VVESTSGNLGVSPGPTVKLIGCRLIALRLVSISITPTLDNSSAPPKYGDRPPGRSTGQSDRVDDYETVDRATEDQTARPRRT